MNDRSKGGINLRFRGTYILVLLSLTCLIYSCDSDNAAVDDGNENSSSTVDDTDEIVYEEANDALPQVEIPEAYEILDEAMGDLDGDGIEEKVIVFDTGVGGDMGTTREVRIYAEHEDLWSLWHTAVGPVMSSDHGGMMGDPYESLSVKNGGIEFTHFGGSNEKWSFNHEFKFITDEWQLVSATLTYYRNCDYSETYTYDLAKSTGYHNRQKDACNENGESIESLPEVEESLTIDKSNKIPQMDGFQPGDTEVSVNNGKHIYYY